MMKSYSYNNRLLEKFPWLARNDGEISQLADMGMISFPLLVHFCF